MGETTKGDILRFPFYTARELTLWGVAIAKWAGEQAVYESKKIVSRPRTERRDLATRPPDAATELALDVTRAGSPALKEKKALQLLWAVRRHLSESIMCENVVADCVETTETVLASHMSTQEVKPLLESPRARQLIEQSL